MATPTAVATEPEAPSRPAASRPAAGGPPAPPRLSSVAPTTAGTTPPIAEPADVAAPADLPTDDAGTAAAAHEPRPATAEPPVEERPAPAPTPSSTAAPASTTNSAVDLGPVVAMWPAVLEALKSSSRVAHTLADGAVPLSRTETTLVLAHPDKVRLGILRGNAGHMELLRLAVLDVLHLDVDLDLVLDPEKAASAAVVAAAAAAEPAAIPIPAPVEAAGPSPRERGMAVVAEERATRVEPDDDVVSADDPDAEGDLSGLALVQRELGGTVMTEYDNG